VGTIRAMVVLERDEPLRRLTVLDYHRMIDLGILTEDDKVELLDGAIVAMSPEGPPHRAVIDRLTRFFVLAVEGSGLTARVAGPITLAPWSEPEPDLALIDTADVSFAAHPRSAHLVIEIAVSSLRRDRRRKARIYAEAGIAEYWIVDVEGRAVEVRSDPGAGGYTDLRVVRPPDPVTTRAAALPPLDLVALLAPDDPG
jgi:Uma2 family endonuclease